LAGVCRAASAAEVACAEGTGAGGGVLMLLANLGLVTASCNS
jgi:hypothetical protein